MGKVLWFTGLSGSGKTTIALGLKSRLVLIDKKVMIIDGDAIRNSEHNHLGFSRDDIRANNRLIAELAKKNIGEFDWILVPIISPYSEDRKMAKEIIGNENFYEFFVNSPIEVCVKRDVKGLYKKALSGEITDFIGISDSNPYQPPEAPDIEINTGESDPEAAIAEVLSFISRVG